MRLIAKRLYFYLLRRINPVRYARAIGVRMGNDVRLVALRGGTFGTEPYLISLGNHVTVAGAVQFITHDGGVWVFREHEPDIDVVAPIEVGNNVFIGYGCIVLPGVRIGDNVVIGAGSVVTKDIAGDCVAAGVPARPIKSLDDYRKSLDDRVFLT